MLSSDPRSAAFIVFLDDLEHDERLKVGDREFCTFYRSKLASQQTSQEDDNRILGIFERIHMIWWKNAL